MSKPRPNNLLITSATADEPPAVLESELLEAPNAQELPDLVGLTAPRVREAKLLDEAPWVRSLGKLTMEVATEGWRFPAPLQLGDRSPTAAFRPSPVRQQAAGTVPSKCRKQTRLRLPQDAVTLKERLLYLLQPPLEGLFKDRQLKLASQPYPYQLEGIAFLMPRCSALLADEMGLGKTVQAILAIRLLLHGGLARSALIVCPKPLVPNWGRELRTWAEDVPFEVVGGDVEARRCSWRVSNCPIKLVNYELLTRDAAYFELEDAPHFDLVVLDEAQRVKNRDSKTAQAVRSIPRERSWALTGTPVENRPEDLVSLFAFIKKDHIPADTPVKRLPELTNDHILRRVKEDVLSDLPPKVIRDAHVELTPVQRESYQLAEKEGVVRLNSLGETITVQHVFELILRLKQICNFDPATGQSSKLEQLQSDLAEIADSGRKAIVFSQWVEPLELLAQHLRPFGPLRYHGRLPPRERENVLRAFRQERSKQVILMSYGTGSVGLNLQCANYVFLFDRWWNPAVEDQAINRVHRIGQKQPVFVTRFVVPNTIEGRICAVLEKKRELFASLIESSAAPLSMGMTEDEIFGLFDLKTRPKRQAA